MPRKSTQERYFQKKRKEAVKNPTMTLLLLEESDVHNTDYDSAGVFHKKLRLEIGAIGLHAFGLPLNGRGDQFSRLSKEANFLLVHKECGDCLDKKTRQEVLERIEDIKKMHPSIKVFASQEAANALNLNGSTIVLMCPEEIVEFIKPKR